MGLSLLLVLCFVVWGVGLLATLGIEMESFNIVGGFLIFYAVLGMNTKPDTVEDAGIDQNYDDISVFPLSIPLIAGPGCLTLTILLFFGSA